MNARDAFDTWQASEPAALHNLTIAEIWMAAYDQGVSDEKRIADDARELAEDAQIARSLAALESYRQAAIAEGQGRG